MAQIDVDIDDFLSGCNSKDIKNLLKCLVEDGYLDKSAIISNDGKTSYVEQEHIDACLKLSKNYRSLSPEDSNLILKMSSRF